MDKQTDIAVNEELLTEQTDGAAEQTAEEQMPSETTLVLPQEKRFPKWVVPTVIAAAVAVMIVLYFTVFGGYKLFMNDEQLIRARFDAVASAMSNGDIDGVTESLEPSLRDGVRSRDGYEELKALYRVLGASVTFTFEVTELTIDGDHAIATVSVEGTSFGNTETRTLDELPLVKTNGDWYLTDFEMV